MTDLERVIEFLAALGIGWRRTDYYFPGQPAEIMLTLEGARVRWGIDFVFTSDGALVSVDGSE